MNIVIHLLIPFAFFIVLNAYLFYNYKLKKTSNSFISNNLRQKYKILNKNVLIFSAIFICSIIPINIIGKKKTSSINYIYVITFYFEGVFFLEELNSTYHGRLLISIATFFATIPNVFNLFINMKSNKKFLEEFQLLFLCTKISLRNSSKNRFIHMFKNNNQTQNENKMLIKKNAHLMETIEIFTRQHSSKNIRRTAICAPNYIGMELSSMKGSIV